MPLFDYKCQECSFQKEHFINQGTAEKTCPSCNSINYKRILSMFQVDVPAVGIQAMDAKITKDIKATYAKIGREALNNDTKTMDNMFGTDKVKKTFYESDD